MNRLILSILCLTLTACAHTPMLKEGSCYRLSIPNPYTPINSGRIHYLMSFKIARIQTLDDKSSYIVQSLDIFGDPIEPGTYGVGFAPVDAFDRYIAPIVYQFTFYNSEAHAVKCNPIEEEKAKSPPSISEREK